jgi:hypothetical protein
MDQALKTTLWRQCGAAIDMLDNAMRACPEELWGDPSRRPVFSYVAYHTLFWLDVYLFGSIEGFVPPKPFNLDELDPAGIEPDPPWSKPVLLDYLAQCRKRLRAACEGLTDERASARTPFYWGDPDGLEMLLYSLRHLQHHAGQLNLILRQETGAAPPRYAFRAKEAP